MVEMQLSLLLMLSIIHMNTRQSYWSDMPLSTQNHSRSWRIMFRVVPGIEVRDTLEAVGSVQANHLNGDLIASDTTQARCFIRHTN